MVKSGSKDRGARRLAWEVLYRTQRHGAYPDLLLVASLSKEPVLSREDRGLAHELVMGSLRWQGCLDRALQATSDRPLSRLPSKLLVLLRLGAYQILYLERIPPSAAVNESVELAKSVGLPHAASYVNAVMRAVHRGGKDLLTVEPSLSPAERMAQETSHPIWMVQKWLAQWGEAETLALCRANNEVPPLTLRSNSLRISREFLARSLREEGVQTEPTPHSPVGLRIRGLPVPLEALQSFQRGEFQVQDEASQLMAPWLAPSSGERILDACAAPGGKTGHLAQLMGNEGELAAADIHPSRLRLARKEWERLGIESVKSVCADLSDPKDVPKGPFDRILLDAPCTGLGVLRRHPDAKWRRAPEDPGRMAAIQLSILRNLLPALRPGGILLYSVCTHTPEETDGVLERILQETKDVRLLTTPEGLPPEARSLFGTDGMLRTFPHKHGMDGFTAFRLQRI